MISGPVAKKSETLRGKPGGFFRKGSSGPGSGKGNPPGSSRDCLSFLRYFGTPSINSKSPRLALGIVRFLR